jgi:hypothetical protein
MAWRMQERMKQPYKAMSQQVIITLEFPTEGRSEEWAAIRATLEAQGWKSWSIIASFWCKEWDCRIPKAEIRKAVRQDLSLAAIAAKLSLLEATVLTYNADPDVVSVGSDAPTEHLDKSPPGQSPQGPCS